MNAESVILKENMAQTLTQKWLRQNVQPYNNVDRVYSDVDATLTRFPTLRVKSDAYTYDDGRTQRLLCLHNVVPISFRGASYNIPVAIWIPRDYPGTPPLAYVVPTSDMLVKAGKYVDLSGRIDLDYSQHWRRKTEGCSISGLVESMQAQFSLEPPVYAKPKEPSRLPPPVPSQSSQYATRPPPPPPLTVSSSPSPQPTSSNLPVLPPKPGHYSVRPPSSLSSSLVASPPPRSPTESPRSSSLQIHAQYSPLPGQNTYDPRSSLVHPPPPPPPVPVASSPPPWSAGPSYTQHTSSTLPQPWIHQPPPQPNLLDEDSVADPQPVMHTQSAPPRPPNPELLRLHSQIHEKLTLEMASLAHALALDAERLRTQQSDLLLGEPAIRDETARLEAVRDVCRNVGSRLRHTVDQAERNMAEIRRKGDPEVDELICSTTIVHNQLINLVAEDNAIEDTIYHLHRALNSGRIDLERFLRTTRILAEEQFMKRALIEKIHAGLPMGTSWS